MLDLEMQREMEELQRLYEVGECFLVYGALLQFLFACLSLTPSLRQSDSQYWLQSVPNKARSSSLPVSHVYMFRSSFFTLFLSCFPPTHLYLLSFVLACLLSSYLSINHYISTSLLICVINRHKSLTLFFFLICDKIQVSGSLQSSFCHHKMYTITSSNFS